METTEQPVEAADEQPSAEDIFGEPITEAKTEAEDEKPAEEQPPAEEKQEPAADPFDPFSRLDAPTPQNMASFFHADSRLWRARSSEGTKTATLVGATREAIVLQQEDGTRCSVAFKDLCQADLLYVRSQIRWQRALQAQPEAATQLAVGWSR